MLKLLMLFSLIGPQCVEQKGLNGNERSFVGLVEMHLFFILVYTGWLGYLVLW